MPGRERRDAEVKYQPPRRGYVAVWPNSNDCARLEKVHASKDESEHARRISETAGRAVSSVLPREASAVQAQRGRSGGAGEVRSKALFRVESRGPNSHRPHGSLTADATEPAWNGYRLTVVRSLSLSRGRHGSRVKEFKPDGGRRGGAGERDMTRPISAQSSA